MLIAAHAIGSGVVGSQINNPALALVIGAIFHFVLDAIPHYDTTDGGTFTPRQIGLIFFDLIFCIICIWLAKPHNVLFWLGLTGGLLPDFFDVNPFLRNSFRATFIGKKIHLFHEHIQKYKVGPVVGLSEQWILVGLFLLLY